MPDQEFAIVELLGHRKFGARVSEVERFGAKLMKAEILLEFGDIVQFVAPAALYAITPCSEVVARKTNGLGVPWDLRALAPPEPAPSVVVTADAPVSRGHTKFCAEVLDGKPCSCGAGSVPACRDCGDTGEVEEDAYDPHSGHFTRSVPCSCPAGAARYAAMRANVKVCATCNCDIDDLGQCGCPPTPCDKGPACNEPNCLEHGPF